jgi:stage V sporulation protein R
MPDPKLAEELRRYEVQFNELAQSLGLDYYPVDFELVPSQFMMEVAVYGLPVRLPHWSFGVRWIHQFVQHRMGHSKIYEVVFPGNPGRAYLANTNTVVENALVIAHVLGHADFSKNNHLFLRVQEEEGYHIVEQAASHARRIAVAIEEHGAARVEEVLDAALALEQHIAWDKALRRPRYPEFLQAEKLPEPGRFHQRFESLPGSEPRQVKAPPPGRRAPIPPYPENDLLWFIATYAPELEDWERDIFLTVREESFYFYPVFACQIMNEGWASYWHASLMRESDFVGEQFYLDAMKTHSDVVRPYAGEEQVALAVNPYHLGFVMWNRIVEEHGMAAARRIMTEEDDFGFIRNYLSEDLAKELDLFAYSAKRNGEIKVIEATIHELRETILAPKFNFAAPRVAVTETRSDGTLVLTHDYTTDGGGLDVDRARRVLEYIHKVWRRPVRLHTADTRGDDQVVTAA